VAPHSVTVVLHEVIIVPGAVVAVAFDAIRLPITGLRSVAFVERMAAEAVRSQPTTLNAVGVTFGRERWGRGRADCDDRAEREGHENSEQCLENSSRSLLWDGFRRHIH